MKEYDLSARFRFKDLAGHALLQSELLIFNLVPPSFLTSIHATSILSCPLFFRLPFATQHLVSLHDSAATRQVRYICHQKHIPIPRIIITEKLPQEQPFSNLPWPSALRCARSPMPYY